MLGTYFSPRGISSLCVNFSIAVISWMRMKPITLVNCIHFSVDKRVHGKGCIQFHPPNNLFQLNICGFQMWDQGGPPPGSENNNWGLVWVGKGIEGVGLRRNSLI